MRITFLQTGDFRDAARRIGKTGQETYHAQSHSMGVVERLAARAEQVTVVCIASREAYRERLPSGVVTRGMALYGGSGKDMVTLSEILTDTRPTHVVLRFPDVEVLKLCLKRGVRVLPTFADTFAPRSGWRRLPDLLRLSRLARLLNDDRISCVGNHNIAASESLVRYGVQPRKVVPWDWPRPNNPKGSSPRSLESEGPLRLLSVGAVSEAKGVGDIIRALAKLPSDGAHLTILGGGDVDEMRRLAQREGVADRVSLRGRVSSAEVVRAMHDHDVLVVFSRPTYPEGLPNVFYEAFAARLPVIASPHPVFHHYFKAEEDLLFAASHEADALAEQVGRLGHDPALYARLSENTLAAFERIVLDTDWVELVERWIDRDEAWLAERSLPNVRPRPSGS